MTLELSMCHYFILVEMTLIDNTLFPAALNFVVVPLQAYPGLRGYKEEFIGKVRWNYQWKPVSLEISITLIFNLLWMPSSVLGPN